MKALRLDLALVVILMLANVCFSLVQKLEYSSAAETFPFFSWDLFSRIPGKIDENVIRVEELGPTRFTPPLNLQKLLRPRMYYATGNGLIISDQLASALQIKNEREVDRIRRVVETRYFPGEVHVKYSLVRLTYDPLDYWKSGTVLNTAVEATFERDHQSHKEEKVD